MTSNGEYWKEREEAWEKEYAKRGAYWNAQISEIYKNLQEDMQAEIDGWYARYAQAEGFTMAHAMQAISKADQNYYARRAEYLVRLAQEDMQSGGNANSKIYFSKIANAEMRLYNSTMKISRMQAIQSMLDLQIAKASKEVNTTMEKALTERANAALKNAQILGPTVIDNTKRVAELVNSSFHGATYSERIWNTHAPSLAKTVQSSLSRMLVLGQTPLEARKQLMKDSKLSTKAAGRAAERLLRTEGTRIQTQAMLSVIKEAGFDQLEFIANGGCCPECQLLDGKKLPVANAAYAESLPPLHPNCRCSIAPYSDRKVYEAWLDGYTEHGLDFGEWKEQQEPTMFSATKREQEYKKVELDKANPTSFRAKTAEERKAYSIIGRPNWYVEEGVHVKPRQVHEINKAVTQAMKVHGLKNLGNTKIIIVNDTSMSLGAMAAYVPAQDVLKLGYFLTNKTTFEKDPNDHSVMPNTLEVTMVHELFHWKDARDYSEKTGKITYETVNEYFAQRDRIAKEKIDKLSEKYDLNLISAYSKQSRLAQKPDEIYTEYRTYLLTGGSHERIRI